jgi:integrase
VNKLHKCHKLSFTADLEFDKIRQPSSFKKMAGKQAKVLSETEVSNLLVWCQTSLTRHPTRNRVIVLLSVKAGLRAGEIANLTWDGRSRPRSGTSMAIPMRNIRRVSLI